MKPPPEGPVAVLYVIVSLTLGGSERHVLHLATRLDRTRFKPIICCLVETGPLFAVAQRQGISCICLHLTLTRRRIRSVWHLARGLAQLIRLMWRERVVIVDAYLYLSYVLAIPCAWLARVPVRIAQRRGLHTSKPPWPWRHRLEHIVNHMTSQLVANSLAAARDTAEDEGLPAGRVRVIHNGVNIPPDPVPGSAGHPLLPAGRRIILCVANLLHYKGHLELLAAAAALPAFPDAALVFVGEGPMRGAIENAAISHGLAGRVHLLGQREDIPALLAAAYCFVLASHEESCSNALLEAMAHALPVVATAVGGNPEIVKDGVTGLLVPPRDPAALARALASLLADPAAARRMGQMGRARVATHFSLGRMLEETEALYDNLLGRPPAGAAPGQGIATTCDAAAARGT
jgi:glycosyltransferase involved in cell wall biosynthesis